VITQKDFVLLDPRLGNPGRDLFRVIEPGYEDVHPSLVDRADVIDTGEPLGLILDVGFDNATVVSTTKRDERFGYLAT